ncbi:phage tail protein [Terrisporobacter petrolearius]|uniref:phage tail protein n=1 Tax=Terrisporobacter petrolearius TaxID=1460447 RepID=UPI003B00CEA7
MTDTVFILDRNKNVIDYLSNNGVSPDAPFFDDIYIQELSNGVETYEFSTLSNARTSEALELGNYVVFKYDNNYKMFQIMDLEDYHKDGKQIINCYCEMSGLELLTDYCEPFSIEGNVELFFNTVLQDTNWSIGGYSSSLATNIQQVKVDKYTNVYKVIQENISTYGNIEIEYRVEFDGNRLLGYFIDVYENGYRGSKVYKRFEYGENVSGITRKRNLNDFASAMIGQGKDKLTFKDIEWEKSNGDPADKPKGQDFVVDLEANDKFNKHGKYIKGLFDDSDITNPQDLLLKSWEKLQEVKEPKFDYDVDLALTSVEYEDIKIGDTNYVIDNDYNPPIFLEARIGKLEISLTDPNKNKCTLSNYKDLVSKTRKDISEDEINEIVNTYFPIGGDKIEQGAIGNGHINTTYYEFIKTDIVQASVADVQVLISNKANITDLNATNASIESLKSNKANIEDLKATNITVNNLKADKASVSELNAVKAQIGTLEAGEIVADKLHSQDANIKNLTSNKADITDLNATNATVGNLNADVGKINTLLAGNIASSNIQAGGITSDRLTIQNGFITNAMIGSVDAGKINTGTLDTNRVNVQSESGNLLIQDNTIQIRDKARVRVQIGKDGANDYSMSVWDTQGNIMFDARGMTQDAIKSQIIRNDMVSPNANINGSKLNINSVINEVNEKGTTTLKSSKIKFDDINQTLDVAFSSLKSTADDTKKKTDANTTSISIVQGEIKTAIENTKIVKDGQNVLLKDEYSKLEQNVGSISSKVSSTETKLNNMKIGGRNLILKSNEPTESSSYLIKVYDLTDDLISGEEYTFVIKGSVVANQKFGIWMNQGSTNVGYATTKFSEGVYYVSFKAGTPNSEVNKRTLSLYNYPSGSTASTVEWVALYKGNKPLDWTAAPEDIDQNISDAIKMETEDGQVVYVKDQVSEINQDLDGITNKVSKLEVEFDDDGTIGQLKSQVSSLQQTADGFTMEFFKKIEEADLGVKEILSYIEFTVDGIILGQKEYPIKLVVSKDRIKFIGEDGNELAYFSDNKLLIQDAEILDTLKIANYGFLPNAGGSLTIGTIK